ncbi:MAG TPA: hypothetical protein VJS69_09715 [Candidatus Krumholzibacteria bacterium]|nr:hypothetical protein [Candidatus Krumholzibacteria bacterium]
MKALRWFPLIAGALALALVAAANASTTKNSSHHATSSTPAHASAPAATPASAAPAADEHLAAVRKDLEQSAHNLRQYHWKETIVVSLKGEDKSTIVNSVACNGTGKLVRTPEPVPANSQMNGVRGATPSAEKAELQAYEHSAVALMRSYIPADPARLRKEAGKMTTSTEGDHVRLIFRDYQKPGDQVTFELNPSSNQLTSVSVNSYLASAKDVVNLSADMSSLADGTIYPSRIRVDTPAKNMGLTVTNGEFQKKTT